MNPVILVQGILYSIDSGLTEESLSHQMSPQVIPFLWIASKLKSEEMSQWKHKNYDIF